MAGTLETLLHFEGANGSATITDATGRHTWLSMVAAVIDTSQAKFGSSSFHFTTVNDYVQSGDSTIALGTADFTIDFWIKLNGAQSTGGNIIQLGYGDWYLNVLGSGISWYSYYDGGVVITGTTAVTANVWHHIAFTRQGNNHYLFLDGVQQGSTFVTTTSYSASTNYPVIVQGYNALGFVGWLDEFRIVTGNADWTANFTPPTAPYVSSGSSSITYSGCVLHYPLDDTVTTDTSGNSNTGILTGTGTTLAGGLIGSSLSFNGSGYVAFTSTALLGLASATSGFSACCWIKTTVTGGGLIALRDASGTAILDFVVGYNGVDNYATGLTSVIIRGDNNSGLTYFSGTKRVDDGNWHHVALTRTTGQLLTLYVDGSITGTPVTDTLTSGVTPDIAHSAIGTDIFGGVTAIIGSLDDFQIYNRALTSTEITAIYNGGMGIGTPITAYTLTATLGTFALTGIAPNTLYSRILQQTTVGNFTLTGIAAGSISSYVMPAVPGAFTFTATAASTLYGRTLQQTTVGTFAFTGITANLIYSAGLNSYVMSATPGAFVFTGIAANLVYYQLVNYVLVCGTGQFYFTGLGVGSPGQGLLSGSGLGTPVVTIPFGGAPVIDVTYLGLKAGAPVSEAAPGEGTPVTKVTTGGTPVVYI